MPRSVQLSDVSRDDERDRLAVEHDLVVVKRPERRAGRSYVVLVGLVVVRHVRAVLVREHVDDTRDAHRGACVYARDAPLRDRRGDDAAVDEARGVELGGIFCGAGDLRDAVDAGRGGADVRCHGCAQTIFLDDCDCGVPRAACVRARTIAAAREIDLEAIMLVALGVAQQHICARAQRLPRWRADRAARLRPADRATACARRRRARSVPP